jgi:hypothetical protein
MSNSKSLAVILSPSYFPAVGDSKRRAKTGAKLTHVDLR